MVVGLVLSVVVLLLYAAAGGIGHFFWGGGGACPQYPQYPRAYKCCLSPDRSHVYGVELTAYGL